MFLYTLSLKVANIEILHNPSILKVIFSKNIQKGSTWRLNAQKTFKTFDLKVQTFAQV